MSVTDVIKRGGKRPTELFAEEKLLQSIQAACLSVRTPVGEAETIAKAVSRHLSTWLAERPEVTSEDLRRKATETLEIYHPDAAYLYKHHRLVI